MTQPTLADCPFGPQEIVETGKHLDYQWVIAKAPRYGLNGYIRIPDHQQCHPWQETTDYIFDTEFHPWGEVTYQQGNWYGFDNHHSWNHWDEEYVWNKSPSSIESAKNAYDGEPKRWDNLDTTRQQVRHMIEQAHEEYTQQAITGTYTI
ncbi:hypothetical protein E4U03_12415 [Rothia nasimurium]|uniref:Uncharacterized protein n=1 Tax=Rothia nasimurium TaxID=85336 RepID=A0A4Y9F1J3_9MICC|nr:hypothetical protein [Rothia nasimurium]MBF0809400.1 hypothetical protein [Rothia nasimurium]TFU19440.1 hypothetical protein E4U03_12415 [Rothia nasimurium]